LEAGRLLERLTEPGELGFLQLQVGKVNELTSSLTDFALYFSLAWLALSLLSPFRFILCNI